MGKTGAPCYRYRKVGSTNDLARRLAARGAPEGTVVLAEEQTRGRGRRGRAWHSPRGGLWFSVVLRPDLPPARAPEATFVAAVAAVDALRAYPGVAAGIKWPNDLVAGGRKLGGILTETAGGERGPALVVGIGINVNLEERALPPALRQTATSVAALAGRPVDRERLLEEVLRFLEKWYRTWLAVGFGPVLAAWREREVCLGRPVRVVTAGEEWRGVALAVDDRGALLVERAPGVVERVLAGDVMPACGPAKQG